MKVFVWFIIAAVTAAIAAGFFIAGSPGKARLYRFDEEKISNLSFIQSEVTHYWQNKRVLPKNLDFLTDSLRGITIPKDPQTGEKYVYQIKNDLTFALCASFNKEGRAESTRGPILLSPPGNELWQHPAGNYCFERTIDPAFYPLPVREIKD